MGILWVIEKPGHGMQAVAARLQGDFAVRVFASVKSFLRLGRSSRVQPECVLVRADDFADEIDTLESILDTSWDKVPRIYCSDHAPQGLHKQSLLYALSDLPQLPFFLHRLLHHEMPSNVSSAVLKAGNVAMDIDEGQVRILPDGEWIKLKPKEAQLLRYLMRFQNKILSHEDLCSEIWKGVKVSPKSVASHMSRLRGQLDHANIEIRSVYGGGYQLVLSSAD